VPPCPKDLERGPPISFLASLYAPDSQQSYELYDPVLQTISYALRFVNSQRVSAFQPSESVCGRLTARRIHEHLGGAEAGRSEVTEAGG